MELFRHVNCTVPGECIFNSFNFRYFSDEKKNYTICVTDSSIVQLGQEDIDGGGDRESDVGGRPALHGPDDLLPHHLVRPLPDHRVTLLPVADTGAFCAGRCGGHDSPHPHQCSNRTQSTTAAGQLVWCGEGLVWGSWFFSSPSTLWLHTKHDSCRSVDLARGYLDFCSTKSPTETTLQHFKIKLTNKIKSHDGPAKIMIRVLSIEFVLIHVKW